MKMKKKVDEIFKFGSSQPILGINKTKFSEISKAAEKLGSKRPESNVSHSISKIIDELIWETTKIGESDNRYVCERRLEDGTYDLLYFSKNEKTSSGSILLVGGNVTKNEDGTMSVKEYDLKDRVGTTVVGALFPLFTTSEEFDLLLDSYRFDRQEYFTKNSLEKSQLTCSVNMDEEKCRDLALLSDNAYRHMINDSYNVGMEVEVSKLFTSDPVFTEEVISWTDPFDLIVTAGATIASTQQPGIIYQMPVAWEYSEEEKELIPHIDNYVWNEEINVITKAIDVGEKNIILFGGAGTGKSITTKKVAELYGVPWMQFSMTHETETIDVLGKYVPNTEGVPDQQAIDKIMSEPKPYRSIPDPGQLAYGAFSDLYSELTGEIKPSADRVDVMEAYNKAILFEAQQKLRVEQARKTSSNAFTFIESNIVKAIKNGYVIEIEEGNLANVLSGVNSLLDPERGFAVLENGEVIHRHPNCIIIMTMNPSYEGTREINEAVKDRFGIKIYIDELHKSQLIERVKAKGTTLNDNLIDKMANVIIAVNDYKNANGYSEGVCGLRTFLKWVKLSEAMDGDYQKAMMHTVLTSCSMNAEIMEDIYTNSIKPRL